MSRLRAIQRLAIAASVIAAAGVGACRLLQQGEVPPLAPRPTPTTPTSNPVPGAPSPIDPTVPRPRPPVDAPPATPVAIP